MTPVIDMHNHLSRFPNRVRGLCSADEAADNRPSTELRDRWIESMESNNVNHSIVFDWENAEVAKFVAGAPAHFSALAVIDPRGGPAAIDETRRWLEEGFVGVKCSPSSDGSSDERGYDLDAPETSRFFDFCADEGVPILFHTGTIYINPERPDSHEVRQGLPLRVDRIARRHPDLKIVMGHVGRPFWDQALAVANHRNVYVDLTWSQLPIHFYRRSVETALLGFGADRTLFGSDSTPGMPDRSIELLGHTRELLTEFGASAAEFNDILGGTASRLFSLDSHRISGARSSQSDGVDA